MAALSRFLKCRRGSSATEFALVLTPLMMLMFAVCEYGRLMYAQEGVQETAIAGARCIGIHNASCSANGVYDASSATTFIQSEAQQWSLTVPNSGITVTTPTNCGGVSGFTQVQVSYTFQSAMPQLMGLLAAGTVLTATACFPTA